MNFIFGLTGSFEINFVLAIFKVHDSYTHCQHQHNHSQDPTIAHTHCIPCIRTYFNILLPSSLLFSPPSPPSHYEPIMSPTAAATCCALFQQHPPPPLPTTIVHTYTYGYAHVEHIPTLSIAFCTHPYFHTLVLYLYHTCLLYTHTHL